MMGAFIAAALLTAQCHLAQAVEGNAMLQVKLGATVSRYSISESDLPSALIAVASEFELPMGIEWVTPGVPHPVELSWERATVREVVESIVRNEPGYELKTTDGVVHVSYKGSRDDKANFLNLRLGQFHSRTEHISVILDRLRRIVRGIVSPQPASGTDFYHVVIADRATVSLDLPNPTVREVLDQLALASDRYKIWAVSFQQDPGLTPTGFRRTFTIWNDTPVPDPEQPVWDRFLWGKPPPRAVRQKPQ
jgi:hypothetical protein